MFLSSWESDKVLEFRISGRIVMDISPIVEVNGSNILYSELSIEAYFEDEV